MNTPPLRYSIHFLPQTPFLTRLCTHLARPAALTLISPNLPRSIDWLESKVVRRPDFWLGEAGL